MKEQETSHPKKFTFVISQYFTKSISYYDISDIFVIFVAKSAL